ncbi:MAG: ribosome biogenesis GTPase Der [Planctomycetota bacterium]
MKLPVVAIVGRPNVGKSSLFNAIVGSRVAIVDEIPGVTRDRLSAVVSHGDVTMEIVDTGGIGLVDRDDLEAHVERQIEKAVAEANAILFVADARDGLVPLDREVARRLRDRSREVPIFLVANKVDTPAQRLAVPEFSALGMGEPIPVSALHRLGIGDLLDAVAARLWPTGPQEVEPVMKLAVVGRRNVGKSTFVNAIAREERVIVSEVPGTTRDAVDVCFEKDGRRFVVIDTAGVRQISRAKTRVEVYSQLRTEAAIRRSDVALLLLDASDEVSRADRRLADAIAKEGRTCVIVANKWDLVRGRASAEEYAEYLNARLPNLRYAPICFTTATDGKNVQAAVDLAQSLFKTARRRAGTGEVNRVIRAAVDAQGPRARGTKVPKVYYATQIAAPPPTFVIFVNEPKLFTPAYRRYLESALRKGLGFDEIPLRVLLRARDRGGREPGGPSR